MLLGNHVKLQLPAVRFVEMPVITTEVCTAFSVKLLLRGDVCWLYFLVLELVAKPWLNRCHGMFFTEARSPRFLLLCLVKQKEARSGGMTAFFSGVVDRSVAIIQNPKAQFGAVIHKT